MKSIKPVLWTLVLSACLGLPQAMGQSSDDQLFEQANAAFERGDYAAARSGWETLAEKGQGRAMLKLGWAHINAPTAWGLDYAKGVQWYERCIKAGEKQCAMNLGWELASGAKLPQDLAKGIGYYRKAVQMGHTTAMNNLGWHYENGKGVPKDLAMAVQWYRKSAEAGDALGMANLGNMYRLGIGVAVDPVQARNWLEKGAAQGNAYAKEKLGLLPAMPAPQPATAKPVAAAPSGSGGQAEFQEAKRLEQQGYDKATELWVAEGKPKKEWTEYSRRTMAPAVEAYERAARLGHLDARYTVANFHCHGTWVYPKDPARCLAEWLMLAEGGDAVAMKSVGGMYLNAQGTPKNEGEARYWLERASNAGDADAMALLASIYDPGNKHATPDMRLATYWHQMAWSKGNPMSRMWLEQYGLLVRPANEQAFVDRIEREGPNRSDPAAFAYDVAVYCQYRGKRCTELRGQAYRYEQEWNARSQSANMQRVWNVYRREAEDPDKRSKCLQEYSEALRRQNAGQQERVDVPKC